MGNEFGEVEYTEVFTREVLKSDVQYKIRSVIEEHSPNFGWVVGTPNIKPAKDPNYVILEIPLTKYALKSERRM